MLELRPVSLREARRYVGEHHRHNLPPRGWLFGVGLVDEHERLVGVGIAGRPSSRLLQTGRCVELLRVCTDGTPNACSRLYGALCRAAKALGYLEAVTYTQAHEDGASLRAAGFVLEPDVRGGYARWARTDGYRAQQDLFGDDRRPACQPHRWRRAL